MVVQENQKENKDQHAIMKAAAWAWYERGSWFEHKSVQESDYRRKRDYTPRPSRYKLEAIQKPQKETRESQSCGDGPSLDTEHVSASKQPQNQQCYVPVDTEHVDKSLLDKYEIERISKELDCYLESSSVEHRRRSVDGGDHGGRHRRTVALSEGTKSKSKSKKNKGFWARRRIVCGSSRDDVVETSNLLIGGRRRPKENAR
ncbi:uncharacterized protein LOC112515170 [Cynara cardunculus var. scolymus]|uniref:Uncharacterized protein n=1 Tax=Cynara cardunculus var. scolymus TaxID=59895 RepID=A0A103XK03_CYNCS|nr:uncharacterized protein LOC112515170 [Cynara cardunculus var. scolymus]KVH92130.1 hypothetical protein Ccrd_005839 [Cynara cardunculus var. scolymus]